MRWLLLKASHKKRGYKLKVAIGIFEKASHTLLLDYRSGASRPYQSGNARQP